MADSTAPSIGAIEGVAANGVYVSNGTTYAKKDISDITTLSENVVNGSEGYVRTLQVQSSNVRADLATSLVGGNVYNALFNAAQVMEARLAESLETYQEHPDVQANLQQLQYDLQQWNLTLTTMSNINKNLGDALKSIASNFR